jgi:hypothetical protein
MDGGWLHVVCGDWAAETLRHARPRDVDGIRIQHDVLSVGPLRPFQDLAGWGGARLRFWRSEVWPEAPSFEEKRGDVLARAHELRHASGVVLWVGGALSDLLLLPSTDRIVQFAGAPEITIAVVLSSGTGLGTRRAVHLDAAAGCAWFRRGAELVPARG